MKEANLIPTIRHSGKGKTMEAVKRSLVAGVWAEGEEMDRRNTEDFSGSENTLYDTIMMDTCLNP